MAMLNPAETTTARDVIPQTRTVDASALRGHCVTLSVCIVFVAAMIVFARMPGPPLLANGSPLVDSKCAASAASSFVQHVCLYESARDKKLLVNFAPAFLARVQAATYQPRILVSGIYTMGTEDKDHTANVFHLPSTTTDFNVFTLSASDNGLDVSRLSLATRAVDANFTRANDASSFTGSLCSLDFTSDADGGWFDISALVDSLFFVVETPLPSDDEYRIASIEIKAFAAHNNNTRFDVVVHRGVGTRASAQAISFAMTLLPDVLHVAREASDAVGYFTSAFQLVDAPAKLRARRDRTIRLANTRRTFSYYIDPSVPVEFRAAVKRGVLNWNVAFENIGLGSPLRAIAPGDAEWPDDYNAGDAHVSSISWSVSLDWTFAIGPSIVDPMTGEIVSSTIVVTADWPANWQLQDLMYNGDVRAQRHWCLKRALTDLSVDDDASLVEAGLTDVVQHEVGHSLGLRHNFKGSAAMPFELLGDDAYIHANGLGASVMDYNARNYFAKTQFSPRVGSYDMAAIAYGYSKLESSAVEDVLRLAGTGQVIELKSHPALEAIVASAGPFVTDEDDVSHTGMDPFASDFDLSDEPLLFFTDGLLRVSRTLEKAESSTETWHRDDFYGPLMRSATRLCLYALKHVGGRIAGNQGAVTVVDAQLQLAALALALQLSVNGTVHGRRVFPNRDFVRTSGSCDGVDQYCLGRHVESAQARALALRSTVFKAILSAARLERLMEQQAPTLRAVLDTVFDAVWGAKFKVNLKESHFAMQRLWVSTVVGAVANVSSVVQAHLRMDLMKLDDLIKGEAPFATAIIKSHFALMLREMKEAKLIGIDESR